MHVNRNIAYEGADAFQTPYKIADAFQTISKDCLPSQNWIDSLPIIIANEAPVVCQFFPQRLLCLSSCHVFSEVISGSE